MHYERSQVAVEMCSRIGGNGRRHRLSVLCCLLLFTLQIAAPIVHCWDRPARQTSAAAVGLSIAPGQTSGAALHTASARGLQPLPHDPLACPICQVLACFRYWLATEVRSLWIPVSLSWLVLLLFFRPFHAWRSALAARAPPCSCA